MGIDSITLIVRVLLLLVVGSECLRKRDWLNLALVTAYLTALYASQVQHYNHAVAVFATPLVALICLSILRSQR